jgi:hypothetical protein
MGERQSRERFLSGSTWLILANGPITQVDGIDDVILRDLWIDASEQLPLRLSASTQALLKHI